MKNGYVILLRGLNTGNMILNKSQLISMVEDAGYKDFEVILNTGNIVIYTDDAKEDVLNKILYELTDYFGKPMYGMIREFKEILDLEKVIKPVEKDLQQYILFCEGNIQNELLSFFEDINSGIETLEVVDQDMYWTTPKGYTLKGFGRIALGHKKYKKLVTSRNMNTINKMIECIKHD